MSLDLASEHYIIENAISPLPGRRTIHRLFNSTTFSLIRGRIMGLSLLYQGVTTISKIIRTYHISDGFPRSLVYTLILVSQNDENGIGGDGEPGGLPDTYFFFIFLIFRLFIYLFTYTYTYIIYIHTLIIYIILYSFLYIWFCTIMYHFFRIGCY